MKKNNLKRFLASLLAVLMLASVTGVSPAVFAEDSATTPRPELVETSNDAPKEVLIKSTFTDDEVRSALANALLTNADQVDVQSLSWTYTCAVKGTYKTSKYDPVTHDTKEARAANVPVLNGYTQTAKYQGKLGNYDATYVYPALKDNADGAYTLYLDGKAVYINKVAKYSSSVDLNDYADGISVPFNDDGTINYAALKERIIEKVVTNPTDIDRSNIVLTYEASPDLGLISDIPGVDKIGKDWMPIDGGSKKSLGFDVPYFAMGVGTNKIKLSWAGNDTYKGFEKEFTVEFKDNRIATNIVIKENASITYNMDKDAMKQDIFDNVIDWAASTPTDKAALTYANFKFEYKGKDLANANLNADEDKAQEITISYSGDANSKPCKDVSASVIVKKADVKVSMNKFSKAYAGDEKGLSKEALGVTLDPDDPNLDIYMVFTGINTNLETSVNLVLTDDQQAIINKISEIQVKYLHKSEDETLKAMLKEGIAISEVKDAINEVLKYCDNQAAEWLLDKLGLPSLDSIKNIVYVLDKMTELFDDTKVCVGLPEHAGLYHAYAIAVNKNYNTNYASGIVLIRMNVKNMKIVMNDSFSKKMDAATAAEVAKAPALLQQNGETVKDQSSLHYLYTGIQSNLKPYYSTTEFPTEPGRYVVTVVTLGGDYLAAPVTKSFQITK